MHVANALEQFGATGHEIVRWIGVEEAPHRESDREIVHHRCPSVQRGATQRDVQATAHRVIGRHSAHQLQSIAHAVGQGEPVPLIGSLITETFTAGLEALDVGGAIV